MKYNPDIHHRHSIRLSGYDYSSFGYYYITICTIYRELFFDEFPELKDIVYKQWQRLPEKFINIDLDEFVIMPNHIHGIIVINDVSRGGVTPPLQKMQKPTLGQIIGYLKYQSTKQINKIRNAQGVPFWQRNYYEHIIRNQESLDRIRNYIRSNPDNWEADKNNPINFQRRGA